MVEDIRYLTIIEIFYKNLISRLRNQQSYCIRWFDRQGKYMHESLHERKKLVSELEDKDIGFIVKACYDGSNWHYESKGRVLYQKVN